EREEVERLLEHDQIASLVHELGREALGDSVELDLHEARGEFLRGGLGLGGGLDGAGRGLERRLGELLDGRTSGALHGRDRADEPVELLGRVSVERIETEAERALVGAGLVGPHDLAARLDGRAVGGVAEPAMEAAADLRQEGRAEPEASGAEIPGVSFEASGELVVAELDGDAQEGDPRASRVASFDAFHDEPSKRREAAPSEPNRRRSRASNFRRSAASLTLCEEARRLGPTWRSASSCTARALRSPRPRGRSSSINRASRSREPRRLTSRFRSSPRARPTPPSRWRPRATSSPTRARRTARASTA